MNLFPDAKSIEYLIGCELRTVTLMRWQTHFEFDRAKLSVEWSFEHIDGEGKSWLQTPDDHRSAPGNLRHLCGQKVHLISVEPTTLTIAFSGGEILKVYTECSQYECGQIYDEDGQVTVF